MLSSCLIHIVRLLGHARFEIRYPFLGYCKTMLYVQYSHFSTHNNLKSIMYVILLTCIFHSNMLRRNFDNKSIPGIPIRHFLSRFLHFPNKQIQFIINFGILQNETLTLFIINRDNKITITIIYALRCFCLLSKSFEIIWSRHYLGASTSFLSGQSVYI